MAKRTKAKKVQLSRRAALWYVTTGILLSLWMFILGVWVGQGGLSWLIQAEEKPISLAQLLSRGRPPVAPPPARPAATRTAPPPPSQVTTRPQPATKPLVKPPVKPPVKPTPGPKPAPPPPPPPVKTPSRPDARYLKPHVVIVASVADPEQARQLVARWRKLGVRLLSVRSEVSGRSRYRLRTLKTYTFAEAKKARERLLKLGRQVGAVKLWIMRVDR